MLIYKKISQGIIKRVGKRGFVKVFAVQILKYVSKIVEKWILSILVLGSLLTSPTPIPLKVDSTVPQIPRRIHTTQPSKVHNTDDHA